MFHIYGHLRRNKNIYLIQSHDWSENRTQPVKNVTCDDQSGHSNWSCARAQNSKLIDRF